MQCKVVQCSEIISDVNKKDTPGFSEKVFVSTDQRYRKIVACLWRVDFSFLSFLQFIEFLWLSEVNLNHGFPHKYDLERHGRCDNGRLRTHVGNNTKDFLCPIRRQHWQGRLEMGW